MLVELGQFEWAREYKRLAVDVGFPHHRSGAPKRHAGYRLAQCLDDMIHGVMIVVMQDDLVRRK